MDNMAAVADHLSEKKYPKTILHPIKNTENKFLSYDEDGKPWRLLPFVSNTICVLKITHPQQAYEASKTFSEFYSFLFDIDFSKIETAVSGFLNFEKRISDFKTAVSNASNETKKTSEDELKFLISAISLPDKFISLQKQNILPVRIIHADPKISNVLFDTVSGKGKCVIDLDTIMPGTLLYDYGDMVRSYTNNKNEDDPTENNIFNKEIYDLLTKGFLSSIKDQLTSVEMDNLAYSAKVVIYIQALRFMTDYLNGNIYYKTNHPLQNFNRAKNQINLLRCLI